MFWFAKFWKSKAKHNTLMHHSTQIWFLNWKSMDIIVIFVCFHLVNVTCLLSIIVIAFLFIFNSEGVACNWLLRELLWFMVSKKFYKWCFNFLFLFFIIFFWRNHHWFMKKGNYFYYRSWCLINYNENINNNSSKKMDNNDLLSHTYLNIITYLPIIYLLTYLCKQKI
jgi:hypothetical protein